ncbi:transporter substrate-binding domain-containing protein [Glycomyces algeriensis]|uniref:Amino acid ABC transporter substrate-binding protein n=1 Tax=Glycomyces algeriensis TaxID=256037 RepID=A0A9W6LIC5_9ACTN|nr:transporter substrate-binding domain-containing protein [Glycomyces algeriensis]MDA1367307.1 transporter substrate-binding domain-containing protein [Glycomyces algeriensis]MDR7351041.1 polar amino acid transport system substrate-binding protein [Glycomyces algeriensis]GLI43754.1 amino acid ABC transporter substrate-binding protein [Glycomyces algeriensis]
MNTNARRAAAALALIGTGLAGAACTSDSGDDSTLTVCTNVPFEPFEYMDGSDYVGFDMDLMNLLAERLDQTVEVVEIDFDSIGSGSALNAGTCDIAAAGLSITEERQEAMGMSEAYYRADQALVVPGGSSVAALEDLSGMRVAVQSGTTGETWTNDHAEEYGYEPVAFETMGDIASALTSGSVDASIADLATWNAMIANTPELTLVQPIETEEHYGFAVQKDDTELLDEVNAMLKEAFEDGTYAELYEKWIGEPYTGDAGQ